MLFPTTNSMSPKNTENHAYSAKFIYLFFQIFISPFLCGGAHGSFNPLSSQKNPCEIGKAER